MNTKFYNFKKGQFGVNFGFQCFYLAGDHEESVGDDLSVSYKPIVNRSRLYLFPSQMYVGIIGCSIAREVLRPMEI